MPRRRRPRSLAHALASRRRRLRLGAEVALDAIGIAQPGVEIARRRLGKLDAGRLLAALLAGTFDEAVEPLLGVAAAVAVDGAIVAVTGLQHLLHAPDERGALLGIEGDRGRALLGLALLRSNALLLRPPGCGGRLGLLPGTLGRRLLLGGNPLLLLAARLSLLLGLLPGGCFCQTFGLSLAARLSLLVGLLLSGCLAPGLGLLVGLLLGCCGLGLTLGLRFLLGPLLGHAPGLRLLLPGALGRLLLLPAPGQGLLVSLALGLRRGGRVRQALGLRCAPRALLGEPCLLLALRLGLGERFGLGGGVLVGLALGLRRVGLPLGLDGPSAQLDLAVGLPARELVAAVGATQHRDDGRGDGGPAPRRSRLREGSAG